MRGIDLEVAAGEVFAFLGPNGAGKTTTVEIFEGYRRRSAGEVSVLGTDPARPTRAWRERVGIVLQSCRLQPELTVAETVALHAAYYPHPRGVDDTIELVGLADSRRQRAGKLSGGQQRRLDVALAMVGDPELLFLDEPTTGFDPSARRSAWSLIAGLRDLGTTVFLTTHYLEEAEALADRVAIISAGRIVATGRPGELGGRDRPGGEIRFRLPAGATEPPAGLAGDVVVADGVVHLHRRSGGRPAHRDRLGARTRPRPSRPGRGPPQPGGRVPGPHRRGRRPVSAHGSCQAGPPSQPSWRSAGPHPDLPPAPVPWKGTGLRPVLAP